jgi:DNA-binding NtrC family response regulator
MARKLLLIDNDPQLLALVGDFLSSRGYEVHRAQEFDEAEALIKHYKYAVIISGTELEAFGTPEHNLAECIDALTPRPQIVRLEEPQAPCVVDTAGYGSLLVVEKPTSLLRLGDLMRQIICFEGTV